MQLLLLTGALAGFLQISSALPDQSKGGVAPVDALAPPAVALGDGEYDWRQDLAEGQAERIEPQDRDGPAGEHDWDSDYDEGHAAGNGTELEGRGFFHSAPKHDCTRGLQLQFFKKWTCKGAATRTEIQNFPLPDTLLDTCFEINSKVDLPGLEFRTDVEGLNIIAWEESGCPKHKGRVFYDYESYQCKRPPMGKKVPSTQQPWKSYKIVLPKLYANPPKCKCSGKNC